MKTVLYPLDRISQDTSIQCRASIDMAVVNDYGERMEAGDEFPPIVLYGTDSMAWIGDGWHRVMAARGEGVVTIPADLHDGGRVEALRFALGANVIHGHRRSNADKRRAVEIALAEFPALSSRAIADLCGVSPGLVDIVRPEQLPNVGTSPTERIGQDGKQYPAKREAREDSGPRPVTAEPPPAARRREPLPPPSNGLQFARMAIMDLEQITPFDLERAAALALVKEWIDAREA